jgi:hypothetical protein
MFKFRSAEGCEVYISDVGCLVIKQDSFEFGREVQVVLTPDQAWEVSQLIKDFHDQMVEDWDGGRVKE